MKTIKFSHNWNNKLDNNIFTTIRRSTPEKKDYYVSSQGDIFSVLLNGKEIKKVWLIGVSVKLYNQIAEHTLMVDTGYSSIGDINKLFKGFGLYSTNEGLILTFVTINDGK